MLTFSYNGVKLKTMCVICILIDKSVPSAKTLINAKREFNIEEDEEHFETIVEKALSKLSEEQKAEYFQEVINEYHLDFLRNT